MKSKEGSCQPQQFGGNARQRFVRNSGCGMQNNGGSAAKWRSQDRDS